MHEKVLGGIEQFRDFVSYDLAEETLCRVSDATVAYCDVAKIRQDFPWIPHGDEAAWLLSVGGAISEQNRRENPANREVASSGQSIPAYRPPRYGRATIVDSADCSGLRAPKTAHRLVEIKGCGVAPGAMPEVSSSKNGLLSTPDAFKELINARLLDRVFKKAKTEVSCIPLYGIVNMNITTGVEYASNMPCCTLVRASHSRPPENLEIPVSGSPEEQIKHRVEETLRRFGLTSALNSHAFKIFIEDGIPKGKYGEQPIDWGEPDYFLQLLDQLELEAPQTFRFNNVQMAQPCSLVPLHATLVDLSHYIYEEDFDDHILITAVSDRPFNIGLREKCGFQSHTKDLALRREVMLPQQLSDEVISYFRCLNPVQRGRGVDRLAHELTIQTTESGLSFEQVDTQIDDFVSSAFGNQSDDTGQTIA